MTIRKLNSTPILIWLANGLVALCCVIVGATWVQTMDNSRRIQEIALIQRGVVTSLEERARRFDIIEHRVLDIQKAILNAQEN